LFLTDEGLSDADATLTPRAVSSPQTVGKCSGNWIPFGRGHDQAGDQQEDDMRSLVFETPPLDAPIEMLGAAIVALDVESDRPIANVVIRLCDVHPSGESLRVSYGVLNLAHRDGHEKPALLKMGERYRVRIQLNDAGSVFPPRSDIMGQFINGRLTNIAAIVGTAVVLGLNVFLILQTFGVPIPGLSDGS
jgi:uncharacterized protein